MAGGIGNLVTRLTAGMRFPTLFLIVGGLFLVNLVVPDLIPFYDEILMAMLAVLIASIRKPGRTLDPADAARPPDNHL
jgi:Family of unknown function (DUF6116)